uniref:Uncharacterized protein n=1 Tax=uncultured prokaryote TaxID=198431 RepID=A0A0H5QJC2_9ZZZZ|nr:hypothetical protein [uncultured prokaryote]
MRNLILPNLIDGSTNDTVEVFRSSPWMLWIGSDATFRDNFNSGENVFLDLVGASGVEAF